MTSQPPPGSSSPSSRTAPGLKYPSNGKTIYSRPLNRSRTGELSQASFAYLFAEMVSYAQKRVTDIQDLEKRYVWLSLPLTKPPFYITVEHKLTTSQTERARSLNRSEAFKFAFVQRAHPNTTPTPHHPATSHLHSTHPLASPFRSSSRRSGEE